MPPFVPQSVPLQLLADALLARDDLQLRLLAQEWLCANPNVTGVLPPHACDASSFAVIAGLVELFAERAGQRPPPWTAEAGSLPEPFFVMERAERPGFTRDLCLAESPEPFKRRNIFSPPNFLRFV